MAKKTVLLKKGVKAKSLLAVAICLAMFIAYTVPVFADDLQDQFLADLAVGLGKRGELALAGMEESREARELLVDTEYEYVGKYEGAEFSNKKFGELVSMYLEGCQTQKTSLKYYNSYYDLWYMLWASVRRN